jgi:hypothetical protein
MLSSATPGLLKRFAERLERAIDRSERAKVIEGRAIRDENCG